MTNKPYSQLQMKIIFHRPLSFLSFRHLSHVYENNLVNDIQLGEIPNRVTAHALNIISSEFQFLFLSERIPNEKANLRVDFDVNLSRTAALLSPLEQERAEALAIEMITSNESCCQPY